MKATPEKYMGITHRAQWVKKETRVHCIGWEVGTDLGGKQEEEEYNQNTLLEIL